MEGACFGCRQHGRSPLFKSVSQGHRTCFRILMQGTSVKEISEAFMYAIVIRNFQRADLFLDLTSGSGS